MRIDSLRAELETSEDDALGLGGLAALHTLYHRQNLPGAFFYLVPNLPTFGADGSPLPPPPASGGVHVIQMLNVLEHFPVRELGAGGADNVHLLAEVARLAYADRVALVHFLLELIEVDIRDLREALRNGRVLGPADDRRAHCYHLANAIRVQPCGLARNHAAQTPAN